MKTGKWNNDHDRLWKIKKLELIIKIIIQMKNIALIPAILVGMMSFLSGNYSKPKCKDPPDNIVPQDTMEKIFNEIKTPYKYGIVFKHHDSTKLTDSPTIYRENGVWYMTYIVFDGRGYETWLAESVNLLNWKTKGKILSFTEGT